MITTLRRRHRSIARLLLAAVGGVWLTAAFAPCVMAAPCLPHAAESSGPCHEAPAAPASHQPDCPASGGIDCQLPQSSSPTVFQLDQYLLSLPAAAAPRMVRLAPAQRLPLGDAIATRAGASPPLYLRHLALLI